MIEPDLNPDTATRIRASARPSNLGLGLGALAEFSSRAEVLDETLAELEQVTGARTAKTVGRLRRSLADYEPSVTLLGQVKAGKTSLINAMAGWADLLPSDVNPWTSVVTSLHLTPGDRTQEIGARFRFMTEDEWDRLLVKGGRIGELAGRTGAEGELDKIREQIDTMREKSRRRLGKKFELLLGQEHEYGFFDKNLVERYICLGDDFDEDQPEGGDADQGRFADITQSAELFLNCPTVPFRMCLRDTPGVNDTFLMREQVTIQAIRDSRLCVVVLVANQALTSVDMGLIRMIATLETRDVVFFINRIDELPDPVRQIPEIEESIRRTLREHQGPSDAEIVFGSAFWANKALAGELDEIPEDSTQAMLDWAEAALDVQDDQLAPLDMVWQLSGLPHLFEALSTRIVEDEGNARLARIASSAMTVASSHEVADSVMISGDPAAVSMSMHEVRSRFDALAAEHVDKLEAAFDDLISDFQTRADRAHGNFLGRATQSLIAHLETHGDSQGWDYSPTGLRMLLRSAYTVFGSRAQAITKERNEAAVTDVAHLYFQAFGPAVEGIRLAVPAPPPVPAPVALGQTIALDFKDDWWKSWWRRTRGYQAFARKFAGLIAEETEDFMTQLKTVQTAGLRDCARAALADFLEEQRDILLELGSRSMGQSDVDTLFSESEEAKRNDRLRDTMETLTRYAA